MAIIGDLIDLIIGTRWVIHKHDELISHVSPDEALVERLWRIGVGRDRFTILISERVGEGGWRGA